jgi:hypothetical protein
MGVYHWGALCRERGMARRADGFGAALFRRSEASRRRAGRAPPLRKKVDLFGVRINEAMCSPGRWEGEAENKKGLPVGQAFDVVSTFRTS